MMKQQIKPYDAEIEYLEANAGGGQAWIDTEYIPKGYDNDIFIEFMPFGAEADSRGYLFSTWVSENTNTYRAALNEKNIVLSNGNRAIDNMSVLFSNYNNINTLWLYSDYTYILNNNSQGKLPKSDGEENTSSLLLFNGYLPYLNRQIYARIYSFILKKAGIPQLDLIPVRKGNVGYMYDRVSKQLFGNSGTGRFILGPDIN